MIFIGKHFNSVEEICFREISFRLFNLNEWTGLSGLLFNTDNLPKEFSINYTKPNDIKFSIKQDCDCFMTFFTPIQMGGENNRLEVMEECEVTIQYKEKTFYEDILTDMSIFQRFIYSTPHFLDQRMSFLN